MHLYPQRLQFDGEFVAAVLLTGLLITMTPASGRRPGSSTTFNPFPHQISSTLTQGAVLDQPVPGEANGLEHPAVVRDQQ